MSEDPRPKKKSRFFTEGVSRLGNFLPPLKKKSHKEQNDSTQPDPQPDSHSPSGSNTTDTDNSSPLLANIHPPSNLLRPQQTVPPDHTHNARAATSPRDPSAPSGLHSQLGTINGYGVQSNGKAPHSTQVPPPQPQVPDSEAETELEDGSEDKGITREHDESDQENTKPNSQEEPQLSQQDAAATKRNRRLGIYGAEALLPTGSTAAGAQGSQAPGSVHNPSMAFNPPPQPFGQYGPPSSAGAAYTFSGITARPDPITMQAQYPFQFAAAQAFPVPGTVQNQSYNIPQRLMTSGVAQAAYRSAHADTGPMNQPQVQVPPKGSRQQQAQVPQSTPHQTFPAAMPQATYVDMDRDEHGRRLRGHVPRPLAHHGIYPNHRPAIPAHLANPDSLVPENIYTSPNRIEHAQHYARISLKRKRPDAILPPPSYVYQHTGSPDFNIFNGILLYPELCFALAAQLPVKDLISLYAISKDFHTILDTRFTTVILSQAMRKAPESAKTFMYRTYANLCRSDPAARIPHPNAALALQGIPRKIPSFRWLKMVLHREKVIHELMAVFAEDGVPIPMRCCLSLKKLWFMLDIPDNARRLGYVHNRNLMSDVDLYFAACFFTKLDMRLNDPVAGEKRDGMRKLLLMQRSFTVILKVIKREMWTTRFEILKEWVRLKYDVRNEDERGLDIFGVKAEDVGRGRLEYWGEKTELEVERKITYLMRPDDLVIREAFRRGMRFDTHYLRFLLYGYVRPDTLENYAPREYGRRVDVMKDDEYGVDDAIGGVAALGVDDEGFDKLLDLGQPRVTSQFTIARQETSRGERALRERDEMFLDKCVEWWEKEKRAARHQRRRLNG